MSVTSGYIYPTASPSAAPAGLPALEVQNERRPQRHHHPLLFRGLFARFEHLQPHDFRRRRVNPMTAETILRLHRGKVENTIVREAIDIALIVLIGVIEEMCDDEVDKGESEADQMRREDIAQRTRELNQDMRQAA